MTRSRWLLVILVLVLVTNLAPGDTSERELLAQAASPPAQPAAAAPAPAAPPRITSPEVQSDRRVTFRLRAPNAQSVLLAREGTPKNPPMTKDADGVWTLTTEPLDPDFYGYSFIVDGVRLIDPGNSLLKPNLLNTQSMVHVPGASLPWEVADVPRGTLHRHFYKSGVVGDARDFYVYTPPGYQAGGAKKYPVLYLLHGFSDDASGWTSVGRAHVIFDNLLAQGKMKPMLVVMPPGYGDLEVLKPRAGRPDPEHWKQNLFKFKEALLTEVLPQVEKSYAVAKDRSSRAIAGLSMGGTESLLTGLNAIETFAYVGAFSSGGLLEDYAAMFPTLDAKRAAPLRLLWIACGTEDSLIEANRKLRAWLDSKSVKHVTVETPGAHTWMVWRRNLAEFAPLLFQDKASATSTSSASAAAAAMR